MTSRIPWMNRPAEERSRSRDSAHDPRRTSGVHGPIDRLVPGTSRVLVVDDDEDARDLTSRLLRRAGMCCVDVASGEAALEEIDASTEPFDGVVLDVMMPGMSGLEVLRRLRARPACVDLPVVLVTASVIDPADVTPWTDGTTVDYVPKPFDPADLLARLRACCARSRSSRLARESDSESDPGDERSG